MLAFERQSVFFRTFQLSGFALPTREQDARSSTNESGLYVQDSVRVGRLGATLGLLQPVEETLTQQFLEAERTYCPPTRVHDA